MREDLDYHRQFLDGHDDLQLAVALRAVFEVDIEYPLGQARPAHARRRAVRVFVLRRAGILRCARYDRGAQPRVGCEHPMKADQMQAQHLLSGARPQREAIRARGRPQ